MNIDKHLQKAERLEKSMNKLDIESDWESIVEICYGISLNYIAIICQKTCKKHKDSHKGLPRFLDENDHTDLSSWFRELDTLRQGRWYGGKHNGETAKMAMNIIEKLKNKAQDVL